MDGMDINFDPNPDPPLALYLDFDFDSRPIDNGDFDFDSRSIDNGDFAFDSLPIDDGDFAFSVPIPGLTPFSEPLSERSGGTASKAYIPKRPHRKSRAGCKQCKKRKVKCDEAKPACKACGLRKETCVYPNAPLSPASASPPSSSQTLAVRSRESSVEQVPYVEPACLVISEPLFRPGEMSDSMDMKMLWFYTTQTYHSFSIETGHSQVVDHVLKVRIVEHAFKSPFLMDCLMALSSLHLQTLNQVVPTRRAAAYRARAFEGYRNAIEAARPADFPALLACSLLMCALSSQMFREDDAKPLYIIDWMAVWRGIALIIDIISPMSIQQSGMSVLFVRPPIDLEKCTQYIPNNLLFMITSIKPDDPDYEHQKVYYEYLRYLGSLYMELTVHGFSPIMDLRVITFLTFVPRPLLPLAKERRPRVLIMLAYYLCFTRIMPPGAWWMRGIGDREIDNIIEVVGDEWAHLLRVPRMVSQATDRIEMARIIIDNQNWTPGEIDLYHKHRDPRTKTDLKLINNEGTEVQLAQGHWRFQSSDLVWSEPQTIDPSVRASSPTEKTDSRTDPGSKASSSSSPFHSPSCSFSTSGSSPSSWK
ncbi:Uu.00g063690.m01.CDS01 [Anthostomella pinea]|uniref:Uu.00g063690.m01.CDS01 n=1 Tax=Anthostomella pinea TaxID=933095 RepID=A0AAI8YMX0_9PEZI|nr:Uu.00g063690.m01.CDS01 [Anthostomella pinea]